VRILLEQREQVAQVRGQRRRVLQRCARARVCERETTGVQGLALECPQGVRQRRLRARRQAQAAAVLRIADQRVTDVRHVHAYLVRASRLQLHAHVCMPAKAVLYAIVRDGRAAILAHAHARALRGMPADGSVDRAACRQHADDHRLVTPFDGVGLQGAHERRVGSHGARDDEQSAGGLVQPVHDPRPRQRCELGRVVQQGILQRVARIAGAGVNDEARRLVDDDEISVLVHDGKRNGLGCRWRDRLDDHGQVYALAAHEAVARAQGLAIHADVPGEDPILESGARIVGKELGQRLVQAHAAEMLGHEGGTQIGVGHGESSGRRRAQSGREFMAYCGALWTAEKRSVSVRQAAVAVLVVLLAACGGRKGVQQYSTPELLYQKAEHELQLGDYDQAIKLYEQLEVTFPFSDSARQGRVDVIYAYYRAHKPEQAVDAADTFIRENPRDPNVDYAYYLKGLVYFEFDRNFLEKLFRVDLCERPPNEAYKAFSNFSQLVQRFPESPYSADASQRMTFLRNCFASYETGVAQYYYERGAWVASANRAKYSVETYPGTPSMRKALDLLVKSYRKLGMNDLAADTQRVLAETYETPPPTQAQADRAQSDALAPPPAPRQL
jgi:outer membrane protein assembly factor BamD